MSETSEVLRRAAGLMRLNAEEADDGFPWRAEGSYVDTDPECGFNAGTSLIADHIASWHPAVALAVADWLEEAADHLDVDLSDESLDICPTAREGAECSVVGQAVTVARAYLGADQ